MQNTPLSEQPKLVFFGLRNSGKSSLMNNIFEKEVSIVSHHAGTTTDPVSRSFELKGIGPVAIVDTAGFDDRGELGALRVKKTKDRIDTADIAVLVTRGDTPFTEEELRAIQRYQSKNLVLVVTFADKTVIKEKENVGEAVFTVLVNNLTGRGIPELKEKLIEVFQRVTSELTPVENLVSEKDFVILVTPIDTAAPKGRLILPQVETLRDLLDRNCGVLVVKESELEYFYSLLTKKPKLVITDSQAFRHVASVLPKDQLLTSFSILFARKKGELRFFVDGIKKIEKIEDGDNILILESCNHHKQKEDIGSVKIPQLLREKTGKRIEFTFAKEITSDQLQKCKFVIHCAGCMISRNEMLKRMEVLKKNRIATTNYGLFLAWANGVFPRALEAFPEEYQQFISELEQKRKI